MPFEAEPWRQGRGGATGFLTDAAEGMFVATWLLGWVLLVWAAILGGGHAVPLGVRLLSRRPVSRVEAALGADDPMQTPGA